MIAAGLVARKAREKGLTRKPWVKTSLAPGSQVVTDYLEAAGLTEDLDALGFNLVGYGCTTCIGNSGPLPEPISKAISDGDLGRLLGALGQPQLRGPRQPGRARELPRLAAAGRRLRARRHDEHRPHHRAARHRAGRQAGLSQGHLAEPAGDRRHRRAHGHARDVPARSTPTSSRATRTGRRSRSTGGETYAWPTGSTYVQNPPYFEGMAQEPGRDHRHRGRARSWRSSATRSPPTTSRRPARSRRRTRPASTCTSTRCRSSDFNSYGARRGNHEVMMRGTFANIRIRNEMLAGVEGGMTRYGPDGDADLDLRRGDGASRRRACRWWSSPARNTAPARRATGRPRAPTLLGVSAVIAESFERIHRSNLVGMGVLPLQFTGGDTAQTLGLQGRRDDLDRRAGGRSEAAVRGSRDHHLRATVRSARDRAQVPDRYGGRDRIRRERRRAALRAAQPRQGGVSASRLGRANSRRSASTRETYLSR